MIRRNNPAGRFDRLISKAAQLRVNTPSLRAWANVLEVPEDAVSSELILKIGYALALPNAIETAVRGVPDINHDLFLKWMPRAVASFQNFNLQADWNNFIGHYTPEVRYGIEMCADMLSSRASEKELNEELLGQIAGDVDSLLDELLRSTLSDEIRNFLVRHLSSIRAGIAEYWLRGAGPLQTEVYALIGETRLHPERYSEVRKENLGGKFWELMGKMAVALEVLNGLSQLAQVVQPALPAPNAPSQYEQPARPANDADATEIA